MNNLLILLIRSRVITRVLIVALIAYPLAFIWQGGDLTDTGYFAYIYDNFFINMRSGEMNSLVLLNDYIGALWFKAFPDLGILGLKFLGISFYYAIVVLSYLLLRPFVTHINGLLFTLLAGLACGSRFDDLIYTYDVGSIVPLLLAVWFIMKYYKSDKILYLCIAGFMVFISSAIRFPNFIFLFMFPVLMCYEHVYRTSNRNIRKAAKNTAVFWGGFTVGVLILALLMISLGHWNSYLNNLYAIKDSASASKESSHSLSYFLNTYYTEFKEFFPIAISVMIYMLWLSFTLGMSSNFIKVCSLIATIITTAILANYYLSDYSYTSNLKYIIPAFCLIPGVIAIFQKNEIGFITLAVFFITITMVIGSNTGFFLKLCYGSITLIPLCAIILYKQQFIRLGNFYFNTKSLSIISSIFILFFCTQARAGWLYHVGSGNKIRIAARFPISHKKMIGQFTLKENARHIESVTQAVETHVGNTQYLFIYGHQPLIYYLTNKLPPFRKIWMSNNVLQAPEMYSNLQASIYSSKNPAILDTKQNILGETGQCYLDSFLTRNNYYLAVDSPTFRLWNIPQKNMPNTKSDIGNP